MLAPYNVLNYDGKQGYTLAETEVVLCGSNDRLFAEIFPNMLSEGTFPKTDDEAMVTESAKDMKLQLALPLASTWYLICQAL